jgi:hypothetical protein
MFATRRKGTSFPVEEQRFTDLVTRLSNFFSSQRIVVVRADSAITGEMSASNLRLPSLAAKPKSSRLRVVAMLLGLIVIALVAGVATSFVLARTGDPASSVPHPGAQPHP